MSMVEKMARAICCPTGTCRAERRTAANPGRPPVPCDAHFAKVEALAALSALEEPSERMVEAGARSDAAFDKRPWESLGRVDRERYAARAREALRAAIIAAKEE